MILKEHVYRLRFHVAMFIAIVIAFPSMAQSNNQLVRLAVIEVDTSQINRYNQFLSEEIDASIQKEPGVITLFGVAEKKNPERVTLFETYADSSQYKAHLATPHFQKYKQGTLQMVKHLELIATEPILYHRKNKFPNATRQELFIRLIKMEIDTAHIQNFARLATDVMLPGLPNERGMLVMYAVSEKLEPTHVTILEVYKDAKAYEEHRQTPHFIKYKDESQRMVRSLKIVDVKPILLGSKPQ